MSGGKACVGYVRRWKEICKGNRVVKDLYARFTRLNQ